jgi:hypothetical protein
VNPYDPPRAFVGTANPTTRGPFLLAGIAALLAAAYWGVLALLILLGVYAGSVSGFRMFFPALLVVLYVMRGLQLFKGDPAAAKRLIWLHAVGAVVAFVQIFEGAGFIVVLLGVKVAINVFGAITAYLAVRAYERALGPSIRI